MTGSKLKRTIIAWAVLSPLIVLTLFPFAVMFSPPSNRHRKFSLQRGGQVPSAGRIFRKCGFRPNSGKHF